MKGLNELRRILTLYFSLVVVVSVMVMLSSPSLGYYYYQSRLPNGQQIPHPCKVNFIWHGVGHISPLGGGARNRFGEDFARLNHTWSVELCRLDSDGDGLTNGQELGDPDCEWREGQLPKSTHHITHPGVCDPWGSAKCQAANTWVSCTDGEFHCDAINQPDVLNITLRIPRTRVPAKETTYVCFVLDVPDDQEYHLIATTPFIDNHNVMHHLGLMTCGDSVTTEPQECGMGFPGCSALIGLWSLGMTGQCLHEDAGFLFGKGHARRMALQFHWTNPQHIDHWDDASGLTIYFTPRLRRYNAAMGIWGQEHLHIPPGQPTVRASGSCSADCTRNHALSSPINITSALNHMHYLGTAGTAEIIRPDGSVENLARDRPYGYDNPRLHEYQSPITVNPGDEIRMTCEYSSLSKGKTTLWGEGSYDEMCYVIVSYYPAEAFHGSCEQWKEIDKCSLKARGCDFQKFWNSSRPETKEIMDLVLSNCNIYSGCRAECPEAVARAKNMSACLRGEIWEYMKSRLETRPYQDASLYKFAAAMGSCDQLHQSAHQVTTLAPLMASEPVTTPPVAQAGSLDVRGRQAGQEESSPLEAFIRLAKEVGDRPLFQNIIVNARQPEN